MYNMAIEVKESNKMYLIDTKAKIVTVKRDNYFMRRAANSDCTEYFNFNKKQEMVFVGSDFYKSLHTA